MKKMILLLTVILTTSTTFARGGDYGRKGNGNRNSYHSPRGNNHSHRGNKEVIVKRSNNDWIGPALILGTTIAVLSTRNQPEVVYVEREPVYRTRTVSSDLYSGRFQSIISAERSWQDKCEDWKSDIFSRYDNVSSVSCGSMFCTRNGKISCSSTGQAYVSYRTN